MMTRAELDQSTGSLHCPDEGGSAIQVALPGFDPGQPPGRSRRRTHRSRTRHGHAQDDPQLETYLRRLAAQGAAAKGVAAYTYQLRSILRIAEWLAARAVGLSDLFADPELLGCAVVHDVAADREARLSKWTLAQRRSAARSFAHLMRPELLALTGHDPMQMLDDALRGVADRVGGGFRLTGGAPRRRGDRVPLDAEIRAVTVELARSPSFAGPRNVAFFGLLAATGSRVNALLRLEGEDCVLLPSGRLRLFLHEKGKSRQREVELSDDQAERLLTYVDKFNLHASRRGWPCRVQVGKPGPIWRNSGRGRWPYRDVLETLRAACLAAGVSVITPHAFRRTFATEAASVLPRHVVALAGGWQGLERLDDHYIRPHQSRIWEKLHRDTADQEEGVIDAAVSHAVVAL